MKREEADFEDFSFFLLSGLPSIYSYVSLDPVRNAFTVLSPCFLNCIAFLSPRLLHHTSAVICNNINESLKALFGFGSVAHQNRNQGPSYCQHPYET